MSGSYVQHPRVLTPPFMPQTVNELCALISRIIEEESRDPFWRAGDLRLLTALDARFRAQAGPCLLDADAGPLLRLEQWCDDNPHLLALRVDLCELFALVDDPVDNLARLRERGYIDVSDPGAEMAGFWVAIGPVDGGGEQLERLLRYAP